MNKIKICIVFAAFALTTVMALPGLLSRFTVEETPFILRLGKSEEQAAISNRTATRIMSRMFQFMKSTPYIKSVGISALNLLVLFQQFSRENQLTGEEFLDALRKQLERNKGLLLPFCSNSKRVKSDVPLPFPTSLVCCPFPEKIVCDTKTIYRTVDGSCNCLKDPDMGRSNKAFRRLIDPDYADDISDPRVAVDGTQLPNARLVSLTLFADRPNLFSPILTQFHFSIGQVVDHDFDRTAVSMLLAKDGDLKGVRCGADIKPKKEPCRTSELEDLECLPIFIPNEDTFFRGKKTCLPFVRSQAYFADRCEISARQQPNALTSWLDSSYMYGSNSVDLEKLRDGNTNRGRMKTSNHPVHPECGKLLPVVDDNEECKRFDNFKKCFKAGDARTNEQVGLTAMHTMFVRLHNKFEEEFFNRNRDWSGEKLFQEARKLVIAVWQNMVYAEYLPLLLGDKIMKSKKLAIGKKGCFKGYNCQKYDSDVPNAFATAAFRYGHSQLGTIIKMSNAQNTRGEETRFSEVMFNPSLIYDKQFSDSTCGVEALLHGLSDQQLDKVDKFFSHEVTRRLFTESPQTGDGTDLVSLNIQRGRDHGIPGYLRWRDHCGLSKTFSEIKEIPNSAKDDLQQLYKNVEDIDLFAGGILEKPVKGGVVGPTFACIIADHFQNVKHADRFWFERCNTKEGFTQQQLENIKQYTSGRMYCDTLGNMDKIRKFPMMVSLQEAVQHLRKKSKVVKKTFSLYKKSDNKRVPCDTLPPIKYELWDDV